MNIGRDFRYALRQLRRSPVFSATAVLTLALGIGVTTAMYSVVRDVLLAPLPFAQPNRLVAVGFQYPEEPPTAEQTGGVADFIAQHVHAFSSTGVANDGVSAVNLSDSHAGSGHAFQVKELKVSQGFLPTLGIQPMLGRLFTAEEDTPGGPNAAILSYRLWKTSFNSDPSIVGRTVRINEEDVPVVGVLGEGVIGDLQGSYMPGSEDISAGLWQPLKLSEKDPGYQGDNYQMVGRLRDGVTLAQAQSELTAMEKPFYAQHPSYLGWTSRAHQIHQFRAWPLQDALISNVRPSLLILLAAVASVLLVACLNLAGLMVARATARTRELAVRSALGASSGDLLRLMLSESLLLAFAGGTLGLLIANSAATAFVAYAPLSLPRFHASQGTGSLVIVEFALVFAATLLFGLLPAAIVLHRGVNASLRDSGAQGQSVVHTRTGRVLIVVQVALAFVLLSGASLLLSSFLRLRSTKPGMETQNITIAQVTLKGKHYANTAATVQFVDRVLQQLGQQPGVARVAAVNGLPLDRGLNEGGYPAGHKDMAHIIEARFTTPGYLQTIGIPLLQGRDFTAADRADAPPVAIVSETAAKKWWPGQSPIGRPVHVGGGQEPDREIVGIAADTHEHSLAEPPQMLFYVPLAQSTDKTMEMINDWFATTFVLRKSGSFDMSTAVAAAVSNIDPDLPVTKVSTMQAVVDETVAAPLFFSWTSSGFAAFTLLLTAIGLFGLLSYQVVQRTREIGVRVALGASRSSVLSLIVSRGLLLTAMGLVFGGAAATLLPKLVDSLLSNFIYAGDEPLHPVASQQIVPLMLALLLMLLVAVVSSLFPARRAASIDPMQALRAE